MRFLLTNDDGIDAEGLAVLREAIARFGQTTVVAPTGAHSGCSHRVTTDESIRVIPLAADRFAVEGTPADCTRVGLLELVPGADFVLAGINHGGNLGVDAFLSGTVAAVREAVLMGTRGIAVSHFSRTKPRSFDWSRALRCVPPILEELFATPLEPGCLWSINLPSLDPEATDPEWRYCDLDLSPLPVSFRRDGDRYHYSGNYQLRPRLPGRDIDTCFSGHIAVTKIRLCGAVGQ